MPAKPDLKECSLYVVHYVPDLVRGESLNIGLLLHSPEQQYLGCLFSDDFRRIKRLDPHADLELLRELQQDFEQQIDLHAANLDEYVREMRETLSNLIQLDAPRVCYLRDPQTELANLFERYVGARLGGPPPEDTRPRIKQRLTTALVQAGVWERLEKRIPAGRWTHPGDPFAFDYGYRPVAIGGAPNGHIKLIHALSLKRDADLAKVLVYTLDHVRRSERAELTAVVERAPSAQDDPGAVSKRILAEGGITICPLAQVGEFAASIRHELVM